VQQHRSGGAAQRLAVRVVNVARSGGVSSEVQAIARVGRAAVGNGPSAARLGGGGRGGAARSLAVRTVGRARLAVGRSVLKTSTARVDRSTVLHRLREK
jgi:uncharacterized protein (DUF697 family)